MSGQDKTARLSLLDWRPAPADRASADECDQYSGAGPAARERQIQKLMDSKLALVGQLAAAPDKAAARVIWRQIRAANAALAKLSPDFAVFRSRRTARLFG